MNLKEIKELIKIIDNSGLTEFHYEKEDIKLILKKEITVHQVITGASEVNAVQNFKQEAVVTEAITPVIEEEALHIIKSPIVGVFYTSQNPDAPLFVNPGDKVKIGQVLCIVEAMKLMNEITSDVDGELVEVLCSNQGSVEFGQPLFKIRKA